MRGTAEEGRCKRRKGRVMGLEPVSHFFINWFVDVCFVGVENEWRFVCSECGKRCESYRIYGVAFVDVEDEHELVDIRIRHHLALREPQNQSSPRVTDKNWLEHAAECTTTGSTSCMHENVEEYSPCLRRHPSTLSWTRCHPLKCRMRGIGLGWLSIAAGSNEKMNHEHQIHHSSSKSNV